MNMNSHQKIAQDAIANILSDNQFGWENSGARAVAVVAAKLVARLAPDAIIPFCDYFAKTRQWGEFEAARWGKKPHWVDDPL